MSATHEWVVSTEGAHGIEHQLSTLDSRRFLHSSFTTSPDFAADRRAHSLVRCDIRRLYRLRFLQPLCTGSFSTVPLFPSFLFTGQRKSRYSARCAPSICSAIGNSRFLRPSPQQENRTFLPLFLFLSSNSSPFSSVYYPFNILSSTLFRVSIDHGDYELFSSCVFYLDSSSSPVRNSS